MTTFYLDPNRRCTFLPVDNVDHVERLRLTTYESFASAVKSALAGIATPMLTEEEQEQLCLESSAVSKRFQSRWVLTYDSRK